MFAIIKYFHRIVIILLSLFLSTSTTANTPYQITDLAIWSQNEAESTTRFDTFEKDLLLSKGSATASSFYQLLEREWLFKRVEDCAELTKEYLSANFNWTGWSKLKIPVQGEATVDNFSKKVTSEMAEELEVPKKSGVNLYHTTFTKPLTWDEREVFINLEGVSGAVFVYVNGKRVGYSDNCQSNGVFNITMQCKEGLNSLVIESYDYSTGSYLYTSNLPTHKMIYRMPYIFSRPKVRLLDYSYTTTFDPTYKHGLLQFKCIIKTHYLNSAGVTIFFDFYSPKGELIESQQKDAKLLMKMRDTLNFSVSQSNVLKWSSESPNLYSVKIRVRRDMRYTESAIFPVGFREIKQNGSALYLNGKRLTIKGINYIDANNVFNPSRVRAELISYKNIGVNSLKLSTIQDRGFYALCDTLGMYVIGQSNLNGHIVGSSLLQSVGNRPLLVKNIITRATEAYELIKNNPSVIGYSLGDDLGNGYNMYQCYLALKKRASIVLYNGANLEWNTDCYFPKIVDSRGLDIAQSVGSYPVILSNVAKDMIGGFLDITFNKRAINGGFLPSFKIIENSMELAESYCNLSAELLVDSLVVTSNLQQLDMASLKGEYIIKKGRKVGEPHYFTFPDSVARVQGVKLDLGRLSTRNTSTLTVVISHPQHPVPLFTKSFDITPITK